MENVTSTTITIIIATANYTRKELRVNAAAAPLAGGAGAIISEQSGEQGGNSIALIKGLKKGPKKGPKVNLLQAYA